MRASRKLITLIIALLAVTVVVAPRPQLASANGACHLTEYRGGVQIWDLPDLLCLKVHWNDYDGTTIYQMNDIELDGWTSPIVYWFGTFDGGGFRLTDDVAPELQAPLFEGPGGPIEIIEVHRSGNVVSASASGTGAFVGNTVYAVRISNSTMSGSVSSPGYTGGFVGVAFTTAEIAVEITGSRMNGDVEGEPVGGLVGFSEGSVVIRDASMTGDVSMISANGSGLGGFVGGASDPDLAALPNVGNVTITNSYSMGNISAVGTGIPSIGPFSAAGFVGSAVNVTITGSYTAGSISVSGSVQFLGAGGFVGYVTELVVNRSYSDRNITVNTLDNVSGWAGGFAGSTNGTTVITDSYSTGDVHNLPGTGAVGAGGLIGLVDSGQPVTITRSYGLGSTEASSDPAFSHPGGFLGWERSATVTVENSFCLSGATNCGVDSSDHETSATNLKSRPFLAAQSWDFRTVWCIRDSLNDGFPVLRAIDFGPGDTGCRPRRSPAALQSVTLDPAGGICGSQSSAWTQTFRRSFTLPTADTCQRDGYTLLGWTRDPSATNPDNLLTTVVARSGTLTAVWGALPAAPARVDVITNFFCAENCTAAIVVWPTSTNPTDTAQITIDNSDAMCSLSGQVFGLRWCWVTGLAAGSTHIASVAWRNQNGTGPTTNTTFTLN